MTPQTEMSEQMKEVEAIEGLHVPVSYYDLSEYTRWLEHGSKTALHTVSASLRELADDLQECFGRGTPEMRAEDQLERFQRFSARKCLDDNRRPFRNPDDDDRRINLNEEPELARCLAQCVPGVGGARATEIQAYRDKQFDQGLRITEMEELEGLARGLSAEVVEGMRPFVTLGSGHETYSPMKPRRSKR